MLLILNPSVCMYVSIYFLILQSICMFLTVTSVYNYVCLSQILSPSVYLSVSPLLDSQSICLLLHSFVDFLVYLYVLHNSRFLSLYICLYHSQSLSMCICLSHSQSLSK